MDFYNRADSAQRKDARNMAMKSVARKMYKENEPTGFLATITGGKSKYGELARKNLDKYDTDYLGDTMHGLYNQTETKQQLAQMDAEREAKMKADRERVERAEAARKTVSRPQKQDELTRELRNDKTMIYTTDGAYVMDKLGNMTKATKRDLEDARRNKEYYRKNNLYPND